ncbi:MAG: carboxymuconolactone decarboxylase family protein [Streptomycetaceae bacterium]|jgi:4-carboxymuconolactone decarboxylase|nr:carboxymuconolactone decarboxylase family protein [Streptomycetaceae bacterium]NUS54378.1 carboxymuconolactone decarboxylase family protein [Streptomycetaceae bacterium]
MTRLPPLPEEEWDDRTRSCLAPLMPEHRQNRRSAGNALSTLVRHPDLTEAYLPLGNHLLWGSTLPRRAREVLMLRVAGRADCAYEWHHHVNSAAKRGMTPEEIEAAGRGEASDPVDALLLAAADELAERYVLSDETWKRLGEHFDDRQRMDLVFTVGGYLMLSMAFNTFGVVPESER